VGWLPVQSAVFRSLSENFLLPASVLAELMHCALTVTAGDFIELTFRSSKLSKYSVKGRL
jgi:hypothetical protein